MVTVMKHAKKSDCCKGGRSHPPTQVGGVLQCRNSRINSGYNMQCFFLNFVPGVRRLTEIARGVVNAMLPTFSHHALQIALPNPQTPLTLAC